MSTYLVITLISQFADLFWAFLIQTSVAKELHFAFATPISKPVFRDEINDRKETLNGPKQQRIAKSRLHGSKLSSIAVALFTSSEDE